MGGGGGGEGERGWEGGRERVRWKERNRDILIKKMISDILKEKKYT